jgi:hypothetical protein
MGNWIDGMDPRKSETLALASLGSTDLPDIIRASFDYGWRSLRPISLNNQEHLLYKNDAVDLTKLGVSNDKSVYSLNSTFFDRDQQIRFQLKEASFTLTRFVLYVKLRVLKGANKWAVIQHKNALLEDVEVFTADFTEQG